MFIQKVVRFYLHLQCLIISLTCAVSFTQAQYVPNFLKSAFEFSRRFQPQDVFNSATDLSRGLLLSANNLPIPTPVELFEIGINVIVGYPTEQIFTAINAFCSASLSQKQVKPKVLPDLRKMNYILKTRRGDHLIPFETPEKLWTHPAFNLELKTVIVVTGWFSNINSTMDNDALDVIWEAYKCRGNINFIALDTAAFIDTLYTWSAFNTEEIGKIFAKGLVGSAKMYPVENLHVVGHSLGAHIAGAIGRYYFEFTGELLPRITGLDAASPCFNEGENLTGLSRGDAVFVDAIHSNSGVLGKRDPIADVDFYPNGVSPLPPGCLSIICAHQRACDYYAESVYPSNEKAFMGTKCNPLTLMSGRTCPGKRIPMGFACPTNAKGNYFLNTERSSPFGKNGLKKSEIVCTK